MCPTCGGARCGGAAKKTGSPGRGWQSWPMPGSPDRTSFTLGRVNVSPSDTQGGSRVPELGPLGSVRGALSNERPYRDLNVHPRLYALAAMLLGIISVVAPFGPVLSPIQSQSKVAWQEGLGIQ